MPGSRDFAQQPCQVDAMPILQMSLRLAASLVLCSDKGDPGIGCFRLAQRAAKQIVQLHHAAMFAMASFAMVHCGIL